jgi:tetratricopeptide (TPR) repeat protein
MYQYLFNILIFFFYYQLDGNIVERNNLKKDLNYSYKKGDYAEVVKIYEKINSISIIIEPEVNLNAAHAYFMTKKIDQSKNIYYDLSKLKKPMLESICETQLAIISCIEKDTTKAIALLANAIELNENNIEARFNFELLRRKFKPETKNSNLNQQITQNLKIGKSIKSEDKIDELKSNSSSKITKEQALQLLEELKLQEVKKYNFKKSKNNSKKSKQDW